MAYEFRKLGEVDAVETATDEANVLIEEGGSVRRVPKSEVGFKLPEGGTAGQVLAKTEGGEGWIDLPETSEVPEQVQPDWNESDEASAAYVKNRTHYETLELGETVDSLDIPSGVSRLDVDESEYIFWSAASWNTIVFDGVAYSRDGNISYGEKYGYSYWAFGDEEFSTIPFYIYSLVDMDIYVMVEDSTVPHTIAFYKAMESIIPLDEKYLPASVATKEYVDEVVAGSSGTTSWNDLTDRPFCETEEITSWFLEETTIPAGETLTTVDNLSYETTTYTVIFDGMKYVSTSELTFLGSGEVVLVGGDGYPFSIVYDYSNTVITPTDTSVDHVIEVYTAETTVNKLDSKYLSDKVPVMSEYAPANSVPYVQGRTEDGVFTWSHHFVYRGIASVIVFARTEGEEGVSCNNSKDLPNIMSKCAFVLEVSDSSGNRYYYPLDYAYMEYNDFDSNYVYVFTDKNGAKHEITCSKDNDSNEVTLTDSFDAE